MAGGFTLAHTRESFLSGTRPLYKHLSGLVLRDSASTVRYRSSATSHRCSTFVNRRWLCAVWALPLLLSLAPSARASLDPSKAISQFIQQSWQNEQGLPENSVTSIAQTRDGYLWLGTESGLARFDGLRFTVYDKGSTSGLTGNLITSLLVDHQGTLWIGTHDGGLTL